MIKAKVLLLSAAMLAAGSLGARVEAMPGRPAPVGAGNGGICASPLSAQVVRINGRASTSARRGLTDPACRYKCTFCGPIKRCAVACR
jgi:hypothetical protein